MEVLLNALCCIPSYEHIAELGLRFGSIALLITIVECNQRCLFLLGSLFGTCVLAEVHRHRILFLSLIQQPILLKQLPSCTTLNDRSKPEGVKALTSQSNIKFLDLLPFSPT